jgi:hypothetical protein
MAVLFVGMACSPSPPPAPPPVTPVQVPVRVDWPMPPARVFRGPDLELMRARAPLAGAAYGADCHCMPMEAIEGSVIEATELRDPEHADSLAPGDPTKCSGLDPSGAVRPGRYLCREWSLGPRSPRNPGAATLD